MKKLILAITTYNRKDYLERCLNSWFLNRNKDVEYEIIIADDGSTDDTLAFCQTLVDNVPLGFPKTTIIKNKRIGVSNQTNTIIKELENRDFDLCFKVDDDVYFQKQGWDDLYLNAIQETGFQHLIFIPEVFCDKSAEIIKLKSLESRINSFLLPGLFYTLTPEIIRTVGYFDCRAFGPAHSGHVDYSYRCCHAGFNSAKNPFDAANSNLFIGNSFDKCKWDVYKTGPLSTNDKDAFLAYSFSRIYVPLPTKIKVPHFWQRIFPLSATLRGILDVS